MIPSPSIIGKSDNSGNSGKSGDSGINSNSGRRSKSSMVTVVLVYNRVEPPNNGHIGDRSLVHCI